MTDDIPCLAEAMAEIRRLRDENEQITGSMVRQHNIFREEIMQLRARIAELEAQLAATLGTFAKPAEDEPATITHDIPPNAPR